MKPTEDTHGTGRWSLARAGLFLLAMCMAYVGYEESRLRLYCPFPEDLPIEMLPACKAARPVWIRTSAPLAPLSPVVLATSEELRSVWLALAAPHDPSRILAVLECRSLEEARRFQEMPGPVRVLGLARPLGEKDVGRIRTGVLRAGVTAAPGLRIIDVGREPWDLNLALSIFGVGTLGLLVAAIGSPRRLWPRRAPRPRHPRDPWAGEGQDQPRLRRRRPPRRPLSPVLPEDVRQRVQDMLEEIWEAPPCEVELPPAPADET